MVDTLYAGQRPTAAQLNDIGQLGKMLVDVTATTNSSTWNSAIKVLTNLVATFTAVAGGKYYITCKTSMQNGATLCTPALGIVFKSGGAAGIADTICGALMNRVSEASIIVGHAVDGSFTASSSGTYGVAVVGWNPGGDTSVTKLYGDAAAAINRLTVTRVG